MQAWWKVTAAYQEMGSAESPTLIIEYGTTFLQSPNKRQKISATYINWNNFGRRTVWSSSQACIRNVRSLSCSCTRTALGSCVFNYRSLTHTRQNICLNGTKKNVCWLQGHKTKCRNNNSVIINLSKTIIISIRICRVTQWHYR